MTGSLTILRAVEPSGSVLVKRFGAGGVAGYDKAVRFDVSVAQVDGLMGLRAVLADLEGASDCCVIRGVLKPDTRPQGVLRRHRGEGAAFDDVPLSWLCLDVDGLFVPADLRGQVECTPRALAEWLAGQMPPQLADVDCIVQWSASAFTGNPWKLSAHLWYWLDEPVSTGALRAQAGRWRDEGRDWLDPSIIRCVQPHYTGAPIFSGHWSDPVPPGERLVLITGMDRAASLGGAESDWRGVLEARASRVLASGEGTPPEMEVVVSALEALDPDCPYERWVELGMAIHSEFPGDEGLTAWDRWSSKGSKYEAGGCDYKWRSFTPGAGIGVGTLFHHAQEAGWARPAADRHAPRVDARADWTGDVGDPGEPPEGWGVGVVPGKGGAEEGGGSAPSVPSRPRRLTDIGNADRLVEAHGEDLKWVAARKGWYAWDEVRWRDDEANLAQERAKDVSEALWKEADEIIAGLDPEDSASAAIARTWRSHCKYTASASGLSNMLRVASSDPAVSAGYADFDSDPWLLGVKNGVVDLRTGELLPPRRDLLISRQCPVEYDPSATYEAWERFLLDTQAGDQEMADYLRLAVGYSLTGDVSEQCLFFLHGYGGNGKGTFLRTVRAMLGDYSGTSSFTTFLSQDGQRVRNDVAALAGRRFVVSQEPEEGRPFDSSIIKDLTSNEAVQARFLYQEAFEFIPSHKLWLAANDKPSIKDHSEGIWRRLKLVPFTVNFGGEGRDKGLGARLEKNLSGVLRWAVEGCLAWQEAGRLPEPAKVRDAVAEYRSEQDLVGAFIESCCVVLARLEVSGKALYGAYKGWAEDYGHRPYSNKKFTQEIKRRLVGKVTHCRTRKGAAWKGIALEV